MSRDLKDLIEISRYYGNNKRAVIAGGGNTSLKTPEKLWVKASGHALATIDEDGFALLDRAKLKKISERDYSSDPFQREREIKDDLMAANLTPELRPSVETSLHDLIDYKFVIHLHPTFVNGVMCSQNIEDHLTGIFGKKALYIPYIDPGYLLFKGIEEEIEKYRENFGNDPAIILLQNHGIFVGAESSTEVKKIYDRIFKSLEEYALNMPSAEEIASTAISTEILPALRMMLSDKKIITLRIRNNKLVEHFLASSSAFQKISIPLTPDIIVYCKSDYIYLDGDGTAEELLQKIKLAIDDFHKTHEYMPKLLLIKGIGMIAIADNAAGADTILDVFEDMMQIAWISESFGGTHPMTAEQIQFIDTWEVENYRRKAAAGEGGGGRAEGKTIIVTGAAMGFGAGIARGLFNEGANLVIADINEDAGKEICKEFNSLGKKNQTIFVRTDVSDLKSLENLMSETVRSFGGIDTYISNAGILRAGGLDEMDEKTFELVTRINYNAYFYGAKAVSRIMRIQQDAGTGTFSDIIQINSKSGLTGSKKNFAYAGGKFGGIGLTQSFALELAPYNIKVNSICPGNFFEGPLWSDPENGLFVQYLEAGKVPGAKTVDDVKEFYEAQVPMGRGCRVEDVLRAVLYVMDQEYETGQAIPVTGGQTMLN